jgi:chromosome segregation ATPase
MYCSMNKSPKEAIDKLVRERYAETEKQKQNVNQPDDKITELQNRVLKLEEEVDGLKSNVVFLMSMSDVANQSTAQEQAQKEIFEKEMKELNAKRDDQMKEAGTLEFDVCSCAVGNLFDVGFCLCSKRRAMITKIN